MKFYPSDWRSDPALRMCSSGARGLWIDMICIMHESEVYGKLFVKKSPIFSQKISKICGIKVRECERYLEELEENGVFSRDRTGSTAAG